MISRRLEEAFVIPCNCPPLQEEVLLVDGARDLEATVEHSSTYFHNSGRITLRKWAKVGQKVGCPALSTKGNNCVSRRGDVSRERGKLLR